MGHRANLPPRLASGLEIPRRAALPCAVAGGTATLKGMAEPSLIDVLKAISELDAKVDRRVGDVERKVGDLDTKVDVLRAEMKKGFAELDKELTGHADTHREIEKDIAALKARPPRTAARATRRPRTR